MGVTTLVELTLSKRIVGSTEDCIGMTTLVDSTLSKRRVGSNEDYIGITTSSTTGLIGCETTWSKGASPPKIGVESVEDCIGMTNFSTIG